MKGGAAEMCPYHQNPAHYYYSYYYERAKEMN